MLERVLLAGLLLVACGTGHARPLSYGDPTLPTPLNAPVVANAAGGVPAAPEKPRWTISSTLVSGERRVAVINGRSVPTGGTIDAARVIAVDSRGAWIEHRGRRIRLELPRGAVDRITAKTPTGR